MQNKRKNKINRFQNNQRGITLIVLVIAMIVMLILASVTINLTLGENGIFTTGQKVAQNYTELQNKELSYLEMFTNEINNIVNPAPIGSIIKTVNNVNYTADGEGNVIPVPAGFSPIMGEEQGTKDTGFVIKNNIDGNEFVWIPCTIDGKNGSIKYDRYDFKKQDGSFSSYSEEIEKFESESVSNYEGFYIGRYEVGIQGGRKGEQLTDGTYYIGEDIKLVVQDEQEVWNYITRDRAIEEAKKLYNKTENNVISKLCSSYAWDTALKFIETKNSIYITDSKGGNYNTWQVKKTGYYQVNNIYDMGGNTWEWTTETYATSSAVSRGGGCRETSSSASAVMRLTGTPDIDAFEDISFRIALFL